MEEIWKEIPGYEGKYMASNMGNIKSLSRIVKFGSGYQKIKEKIRKPQIKNGYNYIGTGKKNIYVHRIVWESINGKIPEKMQINHKNGIKTDNRIENLEVVTSKQNNLHKDNILGKHNRGERCGMHKLKKQQILEIKKLLFEKVNQHHIAIKYGVTKSNISAINCKRSWNHIKLSDSCLEHELSIGDSPCHLI